MNNIDEIKASVPDDFIYYGRGPLKYKEHLPSPDIILYAELYYKWNVACKCTGYDTYHYALRKGSRVFYNHGFGLTGQELREMFPIGTRVIYGRDKKEYRIIEHAYAVAGYLPKIERGIMCVYPYDLTVIKEQTIEESTIMKEKQSPTLEQLVKECDEAKAKFLGKRIMFKNILSSRDSRMSSTEFPVDGVDIHIREYPNPNSDSAIVRKNSEEHGYTIVLKCSKPSQCIPANLAEVYEDVKVKLNEQYEAVIKGDQVQVGCQVFSIEKVKEIIKAYEGSKA